MVARDVSSVRAVSLRGRRPCSNFGALGPVFLRIICIQQDPHVLGLGATASILLAGKREPSGCPRFRARLSLMDPTSQLVWKREADAASLTG